MAKDTSEGSSEKTGYSRLLLPVLALSALSTWLITVTFQILMVDIAHSFQVEVGTASMTASVGSISGVVFGLLMAVLCVRYNHKLFLLIGLACTSIATLGYYFAPNFNVLLAANIGVGAGIAMVTAMAYSIIGDVYPLKKRGRAVGVMVATITLSYLVGGPATALISTFGDWRTATILLSLPFSLLSLTLAAIVIPNRLRKSPSLAKEPFFLGCKQAFSNLSTIAALSVTVLMLCEGAIAYYSVSFFREQFGMTVAWGSTYVLVGSLVGAIGGFVTGLLVNMMGRKRLGTIACVVTGVLTLVFMFMPTAELSAAVSILRYWFAAMTLSAGGSLIIEQLPKFRSTMMSLNTAFMNVGMLLSSLLAGFMLNNYGYQAVGLVLGSLGILGAVVWIALVKEPIKSDI